MKNITLVFALFLTVFCHLKISAQSPEESSTSMTDKVEKALKYGLHGKLVAQKGKGEELSKILLEAAALMKTAKGCHLYIVGIDNENPDEVWITEIWETKQDHDNSLNVPGVKELIGKAIPILNESPKQGQEWSILGGAGLD